MYQVGKKTAVDNGVVITKDGKVIAEMSPSGDPERDRQEMVALVEAANYAGV